MIPMKSVWKHRLARLADWTLAWLAPLLVAGIPKRPLAPNPRVLLIRCDHIGDAVMATAVLQALRASLDPACLDVLAAPWAAPLFRHQRSVDRVIIYGPAWWAAVREGEKGNGWRALPGVIREIRRGAYDVGIDLRGDLRHILFFLVLGRIPERVAPDRTGGTALLTRAWHYVPDLHEVEKNAAVVQVLGVGGYTPAIDLPDPGPLSAPLKDALAAARGPGGLLVLALGSHKPPYLWPVTHAARLAALAAERLGLGSVFIGGRGDRKLGDAIQAACRAPVQNLAGETTLLESLAVFKQATAIVTVDSGPLHLAAASGAPLVALFGPSDPRVTGPWTRSARVVRGAGGSMASIEPERVIEALGALLGRG